MMLAANLYELNGFLVECFPQDFVGGPRSVGYTEENYPKFLKGRKCCTLLNSSVLCTLRVQTEEVQPMFSVQIEQRKSLL